MFSFENWILFFILGTAVGSFLNVVILRFDPEKKLFSGIGGRSHCMNCGSTLKWYELIPLLSFILQLGRCRSCGVKLSFQYPVVEFLSGLIFVSVPYFLISIGGIELPYISIGIWILLFLALLLMSVIDLRHYIIPDGLNAFIFILGGINLVNLHAEGGFGLPIDGIYHSLTNVHTMISGSFLGTQAMMLWITDNLWLNFISGSVLVGLFFWLIYFLSRGRAMGFGDVKLAFAAGFLLGFPDMVLATMLAFIIGAAAGLWLIAFRGKGMKDHLPFGPFIALGITLVFLFGYDIMDGYFRFFSFLG